MQNAKSLNIQLFVWPRCPRCPRLTQVSQIVPGVPGCLWGPRELGYPRSLRAASEWPRAPRAASECLRAFRSFETASECFRKLQGRDLRPELSEFPDRPGEPWEPGVGVRILPMHLFSEHQVRVARNIQKISDFHKD